MRRIATVLAASALLLATAPVGAQSNTLSVVPDGPTNPAIVLPPPSGSGLVGVSVLLDNDTDVQGWSFGICHDPAVLEIDDFQDGATTLTVKAGGPPDFNSKTLVTGGVTVGVVIDFFGVATLPPGVGAELFLIDYSTAPGVTQPPAGSPDLTTQILPCDTLGAPPVTTVIVVNGGSLIPVQNATTVIIPAQAECELLCEGGVTDVTLAWNNCNPGSPADYYLLFRDGDLLGLFVDGTQVYVDDNLEPGSYHYELIAVSFPDPQGPPSILQGSCDADVIPVTLTGISPTSGIYQGGTALTVTGTGFLAAPDTTVLIGGMTAVGIVVVDDMTITCSTPAVDFVGPVDVEVVNTFGSGLIADGFLYGFLRGMISDDSSIDVGDPVFELNWLFGNAPGPFCLDAADVNDSGIIDVADPVYLLTYLFSFTPPPPAPFDVPGLDPTDTDPYGCGNPPPGP